MAKKAMVERDRKRRHLVTKYYQKRQELKEAIKKTDLLEERVQLNCELQKLPLNSSPTRLRNRCMLTGRPRGYFRDFGLSRNTLREMAHQCLLPGVTKSSW
nr:Ribosomal protein S14 [Pedinophyceae sp. YPF-701]